MQRILLLSGAGIAAPHIVESLARGFKSVGDRVRLFFLSANDQNTYNTIKSYKPDLLIALDYKGIDFFSDYYIKRLAWFVDFPFFIIPEGYEERQGYYKAFSDKDFAELFADKVNQFHLPLALDERLFFYQKCSSYEYDISFVGSYPGKFEILRARRKEKVNSNLNLLVEMIFTALQKGILSYTEIENEVDIQSRGIFKKLSPLNRYSIYWHAEQEFDSWKKDSFVNFIASRKKSKIFGNESWRGANNDIYGGKISYNNGLADIYRKTKINIVLHRGQISSGLNQRVFDIAGTKSFFLCERRDDLTHFFPAVADQISFSSLEEMDDLIAYYLSKEKERGEIAEYLFDKVNGEHTYKKRATAIKSFFSEKS